MKLGLKFILINIGSKFNTPETKKLARTALKKCGFTKLDTNTFERVDAGKSWLDQLPKGTTYTISLQREIEVWCAGKLIFTGVK